MNGWEGRPAPYQLDRVDALRHELDDVSKDFEALLTRDVKPLDEELKKKNLEPIATAPVAAAETSSGASAAVARCVLSRGAECEDAEEALGSDRRDRR